MPPLAFELQDRSLDRLRQRAVERLQQIQRSQQLDHRGGLNRLAPLEALQRRTADPGLLGHLLLRQVSRQPLALEPAPELGEHSVIGLKFAKHHL
ncbi:MAG TPA: hypothetical protein VH081_01815 [Solirubrobacteraceae bacterium]|nr:hypothetical protein [Solirubrobacteraceae bacterium]